MNDWLFTWQSIFKETEKKWALLSKDEQDEQIKYLEEAAGTLLDTWTELDEKLNQLRVEVGNKSSICYHSKGTLYYELEMFEHAIYELKREKTNGDKEELRRLYLGFAFLFANKFAEAKEMFLYLVHISRQTVIKHFAHVGLGCVLTKEERFDDAIASFEAAKELTSTVDVVYNLGICNFLKAAYPLAKDYFITYCEQIPEDGEALFYLGCCQWEEGDKDAAWASWTTSIHLLDSQQALLSLAYVCEWHGYHYAAIHCYKRIQEKHGNSIQVLHGFAWNYALLDDKENAFKFFREVYVLDPSNQGAKDSLNWLEKSWPDIRERMLME
ncbi:tetratricopeptide repeat protein [Halalkalibacter krulwichiae]|uniref:Tetratricopeptide repeat protein n=1 Tax=Halalkalibacter krulwichiae TaxID=199441 RepID=A0A1X9MID0_9BACI|nr:hypothetical protein [Halalkalibacter krulwichiae]ARK30342.1 Tetratricopeptide repeat protein [Halalkalibacter krulwichiae]